MKKLLILALIVVTCLSFAACGGDSHDDAITEIGGADGPTAVVVGKPDIKDVPKDAYGSYEKAEVEAALPLFCGTWQGYLENAGKSAEIRADGTCTVLGEELTWMLRIFDADDSDYVRLDTFRGKEEAYTLRVSTEPASWGDGSYRLLNVSGVESRVYLYDAAQVEEVEVTAENWLDYMEVINYTFWHEDVFGTATDVSYNTAWNMQDEYAARLINAELAYEYSFDRAAVYELNVDLAARTLSIGAPTQPTHPDGTPMHLSTEPQTEQMRFRGSFYNKGMSEDPAYEAMNQLSLAVGSAYNIEAGWIAPAANFTITRAEGSMLLLK
ncbi:MAG: hypothetical protein IJC70_05735 [Firmicutes bacterium]|nr:hypothetical protein [Bacillota bacterium]